MFYERESFMMPEVIVGLIGEDETHLIDFFLPPSALSVCNKDRLI